AGKLQTSHLF
ncbi:hypothetical protein BVZ91_01994B, partial [Haemophilus influenzae]